MGNIHSTEDRASDIARLYRDEINQRINHKHAALILAIIVCVFSLAAFACTLNWAIGIVGKKPEAWHVFYAPAMLGVMAIVPLVFLLRGVYSNGSAKDQGGVPFPGIGGGDNIGM